MCSRILHPCPSPSHCLLANPSARSRRLYVPFQTRIWFRCRNIACIYNACYPSPSVAPTLSFSVLQCATTPTSICKSALFTSALCKNFLSHLLIHVHTVFISFSWLSARNLHFCFVIKVAHSCRPFLKFPIYCSSAETCSKRQFQSSIILRGTFFYKTPVNNSTKRWTPSANIYEEGGRYHIARGPF